MINGGNEKNIDLIDLEITYKLRKYYKDKIRIFGRVFIENNFDKCKIVYNDKEYELKEYFEDIDSNNNHKDSITLILRGFNNITDMSYLFNECDSFTSISFIEKKNESKIIIDENFFIFYI